MSHDLRAEIERSSALASKTTRGRTGHGVLADDPKQVEIIKFYEDLTNLLVPSMKFQPAKNSGLHEWTFTCIYTYLDVDDTSANDDGERKGKSEKVAWRTFSIFALIRNNRSELYLAFLLRW